MPQHGSPIDSATLVVCPVLVLVNDRSLLLTYVISFVPSGIIL